MLTILDFEFTIFFILHKNPAYLSKWFNNNCTLSLATSVFEQFCKAFLYVHVYVH